MSSVFDGFVAAVCRAYSNTNTMLAGIGCLAYAAIYLLLLGYLFISFFLEILNVIWFM